MHVRPIGPTDAGSLAMFHRALSDETVHLRFFALHPTLSDAELRRFTTVDHSERVALVAELSDVLVGVGRYERLPDTDGAEVAFVVADEHQGRGIGTALLEHLAAAARERGITRFVADTLPENRRMLEVFRAAGCEWRRRPPGTVPRPRCRGHAGNVRRGPGRRAGRCVGGCRPGHLHTNVRGTARRCCRGAVLRPWPPCATTRRGGRQPNGRSSPPRWACAATPGGRCG